MDKDKKSWLESEIASATERMGSWSENARSAMRQAVAPQESQDQSRSKKCSRNLQES